MVFENKTTATNKNIKLQTMIDFDMDKTYFTLNILQKSWLENKSSTTYTWKIQSYNGLIFSKFLPTILFTSCKLRTPADPQEKGNNGGIEKKE